MAISKKLGADYEAIRVNARFKKINIIFNDIEFPLKIRIPVRRELEDLLVKISAPNKKREDAIFKELSEPLLKTINDAGEGFLDVLNAENEKIKLVDDDIIVDGNSLKQIAKLNNVWHTQIELYFSLIQSETGEPVNETYEEISDEFPENVIREIVQKIDDVIKPNYKDTKKN